MPKKKFRISGSDIKQLIEHSGGCIATDRIVVDGCLVGYMYREPPDRDADTGWRFMAGDESEEYMDCAENHGVYAVNTIANYDGDIIRFLKAPIGSAFARDPDTGEFERVDSPIDPDDCLHPEFPIVSGHLQITKTWFVFLPLKFNRRIEEDSLVLWRPGITLYFLVLNNDHNESVDVRLAHLKAEISPEAFELQQQSSGGAEAFSYHLFENGTNALYGFVIAVSGHVQVAVYFDDSSDAELVQSMIASISEKSP